jgi:protein-tyrosine phosphatase
VLVHCNAGANRSLTVILAYMMHSQKRSLREVLLDVRELRPRACPMRDNREELIRFEKSLFNGVVSLSDDFSSLISSEPPVV